MIAEWVNMFMRPNTPPPSPFLSDSFTDSQFTSILAHTPEIGGAYALQTGYAPANPCQIDGSNRLYAAAANDCYYNSASPPSANYKVEADFIFVTSIGTDNVGITGRADTAANTMYLLRYSRQAGQFNLLKLVAGSPTTLGSFSDAFASGQRHVQLTMNGTTISCSVDGVEIINVTDNAITAAGRAGVRFGMNQTSTTGIHMDNLVATPL